MDKIGLRCGTAPQAIVRSCRGAMYRPRERTVQDLLRHAHKISKPTPSPVLIDGARMQGPGVKEECYNCGGSVAAKELQQCVACDRGFHTSCLDSPVNIVIPGVPWCCGLCDNCEVIGATDRAAVVSMTSSEDTGGYWNSSPSGGKRKLTNFRGLKEVVQQEEACRVDSKLLRTASLEGAANRSKRGCRFKITSQVLFSKGWQVDSRIPTSKTDDGNAASSIPEQLWEEEELAVGSEGAHINGTSKLGIDPRAIVRVAGLFSGKVPCAVVNAYSNDASVDIVESRICPITEVDKELHDVELRVSDGILQSLGMKVISTESSAVVVLAKVQGISEVQVLKSEEFDAPHKVTTEIKLQNVDVDSSFRHPNDHLQTTAVEAGTVHSSTLLSSSLNVGIEPPTNVIGQEAKTLVADQQVGEQGCRGDPLFFGKEIEIATPNNAGLELILSEDPQRHAVDSARTVYLGPSMGAISSSASLVNSPSISVAHSGPAPPFNSAYQSVSTTSSISSASPFEGFQSQSRDITTFTSPVTPQFSKPALEQSMADRSIFLVAKPFYKSSGSSSSPSSTSVLKPESFVPSESLLCAKVKPQPAASVPEILAAPIALPTDVSFAEALDSQLFKLVGGLPLPAQRARKGSQLVSQLGRKAKGQTMDFSQSMLVHPTHASKELRKSSTPDQGAVKIVLPTTLENGFGLMEPDYPLSSRCEESNGEDNRDGSSRSLLVEDVKVCDTCGNAGYEELLALCSSCNEGAEHTYCMSTQMDALPEGDWICETCQIKQRQAGPRTLERLLVPSKSQGRSTSVNTRLKPVSTQGSSRSRLVDRLHNKKPRIIQVGKSPSKAPIVQTWFQRSPSDSVVSPIFRKLVTENSFRTISTTSPPSTLVVSSPVAKPSLTREKTFKCTPETGKVKFLAPSAVANFSSGERANAIKPARVVSQIPKPAATGQAGNKNRFASLSSISDLSTPPTKATNLNSSRASPMTPSSPTLSKLSSDSNSRLGHGMKCSGQIKNSRDGCVPDGVPLPPGGREAPSSASQSSDSKVTRLGRNTSSGGITGEPLPYSDTPRTVLESGRCVQRSGEPRPFPDTPRPQIEYGRGPHRGGPGNGGSNAAGIGQDASKVDCKDKASCRFESASVVGSGESGRVSFELALVSGFPGNQSKPDTSIWSAPWLGDSSSIKCFSCKSLGHSIQDCPSPILLASEQKALSGSSNLWGTSSKPKKNSVLMFNDIDANVQAVESKAGLEEKANLSSGLQIAIESFPAGCNSSSEKLKPLLRSPTPTGLVRGRLSNIKLYDSSVAVSKVSSLLNGAFFQKLVSDETSGEVSFSENGDGSFRQELRAESGPSSNLWMSGGAYENQRLPGVPGSESAYVDSKVTAVRINTSPPIISETGFSINASQATGMKVPQGDAIQLTEATVGRAPHVMQRGLPASGSLPPWLVSLPSHAVGGLEPGRVEYPSGLIQCFPPLGPVMYRQGPQIPYLTSQPTPSLPKCAPPAPPTVPSPTPPSPAAQVDAAVPSAAIAWRGAFEVNDGQSRIVFDEIMAHVSTKAVAKVYEVATSLPQQLRLEQVQRSTDLETWPRQFNIRPPTDGSIALYFFATNGESFERFRHNLVNKMVALDLVLRAHVDNAELLIFPSDKLSHKFQRWHGHPFLWGVFRARKHLVKPVSTSTVEVKGPWLAAAPCSEVSSISPHVVPRAAPVCNITPNMKHPNSSSTGCDIPGEIDMEVDMEGGKECGRSDKLIKRPDNANPAYTRPLSTLVSIRAPVVSAPECPVLNSDYADNVQDKPSSIKTQDLDLPPGFAPGLALPLTPVALEMPTRGLTIPPGFSVKPDAQKQVDFGSSAGSIEDPEKGGSKLKRSITTAELVMKSNTSQTSPHFAPCSKEDAETRLPSSRPTPTKRSRSKSRSPIRPKEKGREIIRDRLCERVKDREKRELDLKLERRDKSREWAREVHRDRDRDRDYERGKDRQRHRPRDRDRDGEAHNRSNERARPRDKVRLKERSRARERNRERDRDRERVKEREREKEWHLDKVRDRKFHRPRDSDQDLHSRIRSRSRSRSRSPARRKFGSWTPGAGRRKAWSRTPPRQKTSSPSPSRIYLGSYRQYSISGSDSLGSQSLEILQGSAIGELRFRKPDRESVQGKRSITLDKDVGDKGSRPSSRWKSAQTVDDARSGSAGGSNYKTVGRLDHPNTVPVSRSVTPVLDMNEGVSEAFSAEGAAASTSLPDLNTDSVESGVAFHDFLPADEMEPETAIPIAEQTFPGAARAAVIASLSTRVNSRNQDDEPILAGERWGFAVSSLGLRQDFTSRSSSGYQFIHAPRLEESIFNPNPDLELALGGRETASSERTNPLPLFLNGHTRLTPNLGSALNAKSPDLSVGLSNPYQSGPLDMVCEGTASLSLSLAVPQYRREGNTWIQVEECEDVSDIQDVDFSLTL